MLEGSCLCAGVRYRAEGPLGEMSSCHCGMCRKAHGAAYATFITVPLAGFRVVRGSELVATYSSSSELDRLFCRVCGSSFAIIEAKTGEAFVAAGTLDVDPGVRPTSQIFVGSKSPWVEIEDDIPAFDEYPPDEQ